uniref:Uncharacterized protein n=1 Tax=Romanomermis culicivorax TaxID=13658 RepID=A0A915IDB8_ROMCU
MVYVPELIMVDFSKAFQSVPECPTEIETTLTGSLPRWLNGTLLKNGPGVFEVGPDSFRHWFDGFAIFQRFRFTDGKVFYKSKHLRSDSYKNCLKANRIVTAQFGTPASLDPSLNFFRRYSKKFLPPKLTDNDVVNFVQFGDQVWAATETTLMHQIDPATLDTTKKVDMSKYVAVNVETAHQHYDKRGNVYNIGWSLNTYKVFVTPNSDLFKQTTNLEGFEKTKIMATIKSKRKGFVSYFHSFAMTENYIIFVEMPLLINTIKLLSAHVRTKSFKDSLTWKHDQKV